MGTGNVTPGLPWDKLASVQTQLIPWGFKSLPADWAADSMGTHGVAGGMLDVEVGSPWTESSLFWTGLPNSR